MGDINITMIGAGGRMGQSIINAIANGMVPGTALAGAVDAPGSPLMGQSLGGCTVTEDLQAGLKGADAAIDFTTHAAVPANVAACCELGLPLVIGTTGLSPNEEQAVKDASEKIPIMMAANMSLGVNLLSILVKDAAAALRGRGYDIEIVEKHHRRKKDAPSGTALLLGRAAAEGLEKPLEELELTGRSGLSDSDRPVDQIGFHAVRGGDIVGDHNVYFAAETEVLELAHRATRREVFAIGALQAAVWITGQAPGLYSMRDVLGL